MLRTLIIRNYVLIERLELDFHSGFTSITGETGAGKSILLGAIGLLMGQRADHSIIRPGSDKCIIEAHFGHIDKTIKRLLAAEDIDCDESELIIRREVSAKGKSRAFVNDTPASLALLKQLSEYLIDIHSQHKNLLLGDAQFQLAVLDLYGNNQSEREAYYTVYKRYQHLCKELEEARRTAQEAMREQDFIQFQFTQLDEAALQRGELEALENEEQALSHALDIKAGLARAYSTLDDDERGALSALSTALDALGSVRRYWPSAEELYERVQSARLELRDIADTLSQQEESIEYDPERLALVAQRLDLLNTLLTKHNCSDVEALIALREDLDQRLQAINNSDETIRELEEQLSQCLAELHHLAQTLYDSRQASAKAIEGKLVEGLRILGMPHVRFEIKLVHSTHYGATGADTVTYLFSANKDIPLEPVADIASGGEISRLMLCIKSLIADRRQLPTIIFDEIDTGVSGDIADRIGHILQQMGHSMQVMAVTHLPQIAAAGSQHIYIYKEHKASSTLSHIRYLEENERIEEIARMQSGSNLSAITLAAAKELLDKAKSR